jgi:hypothetical protein
MIAYLEYVSGREPTGCLAAGEFYCNTIPKGKALSFRSPLVCPSEVNKVFIVSNNVTDMWFKRLKDQDVVMINMFDLSMPQQGGMDFDSDAVLLCHDPILVNSKINKTIIIDVDDKVTTISKQYTKKNIVDYEMSSRDNRIGEITNIATSILNQYVKDDKWKKINDDNVSLLRILQGKEIDFQKTGVRWHITSFMRKSGKRPPYFLLYNYPDKLSRYYAIKRNNSFVSDPKEKIPLNAYHSPSPLNELCDYILSWEKKRIVWDNSCVNTHDLVVDTSLDLSDMTIRKQMRDLINTFANDWKDIIKRKEIDERVDVNAFLLDYKKKVFIVVNKDDVTAANYCISVSYRHINMCKALAWHVFGDEILNNLRNNSPPSKGCFIINTTSSNPNAFEYLGKYYELIEGDESV